MKYFYEGEGGATPVHVEKLGGVYWIHVDGQTHQYDPESLGGGGRRQKAAHTDEVVAPMPGKVTKVLVSIGDTVEVGQVVLVMEAMKMEYSLKAQASGKIEKLDCKVGDQVMLGKLLCKVKA